ncbi:hypothetical protein VT84_02225 [Gemmata sp. SH-PL17]|nr:hypothetical protein VT84_02225 [Gemmata sp. SH-PL17]
MLPRMPYTQSLSSSVVHVVLEWASEGEAESVCFATCTREATDRPQRSFARAPVGRAIGARGRWRPAALDTREKPAVVGRYGEPRGLGHGISLNEMK